MSSLEKLIEKGVKKQPVFNAKNYRNSPLIREFYRFVAKNGLRAEAHKVIENASNNKKRADYLLSFDM
ncbi:MAG: hypothetical protein JXA66_04505 [Oligoflexia bacterium]|nr:hypothetical protein [Oligoflexia bacterium]